MERPRDKRREATRFLLKLIKALEVVDAVVVFLAYAKHHGSCRPHPDLVGRAMHIQPVVGQTLQTRDLVAHLVIENFRAAAGNRIQSGIAQPQDRIADRHSAVFRNRDNLGS